MVKKTKKNIKTKKNTKTKKNNNKTGSRNAINSSNGYYYQRIYFCLELLKKLETDENMIMNIKCIEEGNIHGNEYEDFSFEIDEKIYTFQIKYVSTTESIAKDSDFMKTFTHYINDPKIHNVAKIYYVVAKKGEKSNIPDILKLTETDPTIVYKYMYLLANNYDVKIHYSTESIKEKYNEIVDNSSTESDDDVYNTNNESNNFEMFKNYIKSHDKNDIICYIKKFKMIDGFTYIELNNHIKNKIKELLISNGKQNPRRIVVEYLRMKIIDELTNNAFNNNEPFKLQDICNCLKKFYGDEETKEDFEIFNEIYMKLINKIKLSHDIIDKQIVASELKLHLKNLREIKNMSLINELSITDKDVNILHNAYVRARDCAESAQHGNEDLIKCYKKLVRAYCVQQIYKLNNSKHSNYDVYYSTISSMFGYWNHDIKVKMDINRSQLGKCTNNITEI